ncbi:hypothetical protein DENSPDRAFT_641934 [Dentipellis sp. KUC8613]|nr:hypothetical protein DENSPDRAFT_641934 [Dentipellis sp. KUC8613]
MDDSSASPQSPDPSSSVSQTTLGLPSPSMQSQIHELAKSLPPPRKQNIACDACRQRKVKCHQIPGQSKCQHCIVKNYPCTHHAQQATSEKKRVASVARRPRPYSTSNSSQSPTAVKPSVPSPPIAPQPNSSFRKSYPSLHPSVRRNTTFTELLAFLFAPPDDPSDADPYNQSTYRMSPYKDWGELAYKLEDEAFRIEFALDLVEVYFQIVHTRLPFLNPAQFRARLTVNLPQYANQYASATGMGVSSVSEDPLHPALVATVIAWGAKFSEHAVLVAGRAQNGKQSNLAKTLIARAREVAETLKVHRVPVAEHVVIALLIEPLQSQLYEDSSGFRGFWLQSAIRQLFELQINHKSVISNIQDPEARGTMIFAWWMACLADAYGATYYRRKPQVEDTDYDIDFYTVDPVSLDPDGQMPKPDPREHLEFLGYYRAAHALARVARHMSKVLWIPSTDADGVPMEVLRGIIHQLNEWREQYLPHVGVPTNFAAEWDFVSAVSACASDATFHIMWIILFNALDDFGIRELNEAVHMGSPGAMLPNFHHIEELKRKVLDEALHGALRIAGLAGVLTKNGYLRLDPAVMHVSTNYAGVLLARFGRPEVKSCIEGLEQYSYSYEEGADQAADLRRLYTLASRGEGEFQHMTSVIPRAVPSHAHVASDAQMYMDATNAYR